MAARRTGRPGKAVAHIVTHHGQHRTTALAEGSGQYLLHAAEKAEHHGVEGHRRRIGQHIGAQGRHIRNAAGVQLLPQDGQGRGVALRRRDTGRMGRQGQGQVSQAAAGVADMIRGLQVRQQQRRQLFVEVGAAAGIGHEAHGVR